jgi:hypothetical protein
MPRNRSMKLSYKLYVYVDDDGHRLDKSAYISRSTLRTFLLGSLCQRPDQMLHGASLFPG